LSLLLKVLHDSWFESTVIILLDIFVSIRSYDFKVCLKLFTDVQVLQIN